jgi:DNA-binding NarL/FixJ family response regulator
MSASRIVRVMLVEDHAAFRQSLAALLEREPDLEVVAQAGSLAQARKMLHTPLDLAVLDLALPDGDGRDLIDLITRWVLCAHSGCQGERGLRASGRAKAAQ